MRSMTQWMMVAGLCLAMSTPGLSLMPAQPSASADQAHSQDRQGRIQSKNQPPAPKGSPAGHVATIISGGGGGGTDPAGAIITSPATGSTVYTGQSVSFTGSTDTGTSFTWTFGDGATATTLNTTHTYTATGTYTVSLRASASGYIATTATISLTVAAPPPLPTIQSFSASPTVVQPGGVTTLSWATTNATSLSISGIGAVTGTSKSVSPSSTTTYTLTVTNSSGSTTAAVTVTLNNPPAFTASITPSSFIVHSMQSITLPGATDPEGDAIAYWVTGIPEGMTFDATSRQVSGAATTPGTYTIVEFATDARGATGSQSGSWTIAPNQSPVFSNAMQPVSIMADATQLTTLPGATDPEGDAFTFSASGLPPGLTFNTSSRLISGSATTVGTYTVTETVTDVWGGAKSQSATWTVTVPPVPVINTFTGTPSTAINPGQSSTLGWTLTNPIRSLTLSSIGDVTGTGSKAVSPSATATYTLTATNLGGTATKDWTVVVNRPPSIFGALPLPGLRVNDYATTTLPSGTDPDGDTCAYTVTGLPPGLSFNAATRIVAGTPTTAGTYLVTEMMTDPLGLTGSQSATWTVAAYDAATDAPTPSLPADDSVFHNAQFSEVMGYAGSDTGLITSVQVNRQLQTAIAALATGHDRATQSSYTYGYDPLGQLVVANGTYTDPTGQVAAWTDNTTYAYDAHGNRTSNTRADGSTWAYAYNAGNNQLASAGPKAFTYTADGAVQSIAPGSGQTADTQTFTYGDPRFMRLPTQIVRNAVDGRVVTTDAWYDMSGTRVTKRDQVWQGTGTADKTKLLSDRETIYLANGTDVLMETELRGSNGVLAPSRFTAYIFGAGSRLARLSWDADGRSATEAGTPIGVANPGFDDGTATNWVPSTGTTAAGLNDATEGPSLKLIKGPQTLSYVQQAVGTFQAGDTLELKALVRGDGAGGGARIAFSGASAASSSTTTASTWSSQRIVTTLATGGALNIQLLVDGVELQQAYFDQVTVRKLPPATVASGKPNLWPDPGFESVLGQGGGVSAAGAAAIAPGTREGLHVLTLPTGATYARQVTGLDATKRYLFSVWKDPGTGWVRELRSGLAPDSGGALTVTLNQAGSYDQAELVEDPGTAVESWIPENRLGRVDWFLTDHLGSTKLLVSQDGSWRYTGDDDPFGINLRSLGDKEAHRYTGQILDEKQNIYYYGGRYFLPEIGRFLATDPKMETPSPYSYVGNNPIGYTDPTGQFKVPIHRQIISRAAEMAGYTNDDLKEILKLQSKVDDLSGQFHSEYHFDNKNYAQILANFVDFTEPNLRKGGTFEKAAAMHSIGDFYSHSNYVELYLTVHPDAKPQDVPTLKEALAGNDSILKGVLKSDLHTGSFSLVRFIFGDILHIIDPTGHSKLNKDNNSSQEGSKIVNGSTLSEFAQDVATRHLADAMRNPNQSTVPTEKN